MTSSFSLEISLPREFMSSMSLLAPTQTKETWWTKQKTIFVRGHLFYPISHLIPPFFFLFFVWNDLLFLSQIISRKQSNIFLLSCLHIAWQNQILTPRCARHLVYIFFSIFFVNSFEACSCQASGIIHTCIQLGVIIIIISSSYFEKKLMANCQEESMSIESCSLSHSHTQTHKSNQLWCVLCARLNSLTLANRWLWVYVYVYDFNCIEMTHDYHLIVSCCIYMYLYIMITYTL